MGYMVLGGSAEIYTCAEKKSVIFRTHFFHNSIPHTK
jgi:hypothetical protein